MNTISNLTLISQVNIKIITQKYNRKCNSAAPVRPGMITSRCIHHNLFKNNASSFHKKNNLNISRPKGLTLVCYSYSDNLSQSLIYGALFARLIYNVASFYKDKAILKEESKKEMIRIEERHRVSLENFKKSGETKKKG